MPLQMMRPESISASSLNAFERKKKENEEIWANSRPRFAEIQDLDT